LPFFWATLNKSARAGAPGFVWDGLLGLHKRSNAQWHCEQLQRSRSPESADAHGAATYAEHP
jgi:hypothetical protein